MLRKGPSLNRIFVTVVGLVFLALPPMALAQSQLDHVTPEFEHIKTVQDPKHTPMIEVPPQVVAGRWFPVTVTVGYQALHPTLVDHYVRSISLYKNDVELGRVYLSSADMIPKATFFITLEADTTLRALAEPTHSAAWEAKKEIRVISP